MPQAGILGTLHYEGGREETKDFEDAILFTPDKVIQWLRDKLPDPISRSSAERKNIMDTFYELVRRTVTEGRLRPGFQSPGGSAG